jgi:hypothetical protein
MCERSGSYINGDIIADFVLKERRELKKYG